MPLTLQTAVATLEDPGVDTLRRILVDDPHSHWDGQPTKATLWFRVGEYHSRLHLLYEADGEGCLVIFDPGFVGGQVCLEARKSDGTASVQLGADAPAVPRRVIVGKTELWAAVSGFIRMGARPDAPPGARWVSYPPPANAPRERGKGLFRRLFRRRDDEAPAPPSKRKLQEVGFFRELGDGDACPSLLEALQAGPHPDADHLVGYLRSGTTWIVSLGLTRDVFDGVSMAGSLSQVTDGVYVWPEQLAYYVGTYRIALPPDFVAHARKQGWQCPTDVDTSVVESDEQGPTARSTSRTSWSPPHLQDPTEYQVVVALEASTLKAHRALLVAETGLETGELFRLAKDRARVTLSRGTTLEVHPKLLACQESNLGVAVVPPYPWELKALLPERVGETGEDRHDVYQVRGSLQFSDQAARDRSAACLYRLLPARSVHRAGTSLTVDAQLVCGADDIEDAAYDATERATGGSLRVYLVHGYHMVHHPARGPLAGFEAFSDQAQRLLRAVVEQDDDGVGIGRGDAGDYLAELARGYWYLDDDSQRAWFGVLVCDQDDPVLADAWWDILRLPGVENDDNVAFAQHAALCGLEGVRELAFESDDRDELAAAVEAKLRQWPPRPTWCTALKGQEPFRALKPVHPTHLSRMRRQLREAPADFVAFLAEIGFGEVGDSRLMLYGPPAKPQAILDADAAKPFEGLWLFGDDYHGHFFGYDPSRDWAVVELDPGEGAVQVIAESFEEFVRARIVGGA